MVQAFTIIYVGFSVDPNKHHYILKDKGFVLDQYKNKGDYEAFYELTNQGEVINLNEYCAWIADTRYESSFPKWRAELDHEIGKRKISIDNAIDKDTKLELKKSLKTLQMQNETLNSRTHLIQMNDSDFLQPQIITPSMVQSTKEDF